MSDINKPKGRKATEFTDKQIIDALEIIANDSMVNIDDIGVSAYHLKLVFIEKLGYVEFTLGKAKNSRGRRRKIYNLTPEGAVHLTYALEKRKQEEKDKDEVSP